MVIFQPIWPSHNGHIHFLWITESILTVLTKGSLYIWWIHTYQVMLSLKNLFIWNKEKLSKSSHWIPFFRLCNGKNSCWKTESIQGEKGCWSWPQGKVPPNWAREVEKRCWDREKEENWWLVWEGSEMEAQAVERSQRTTEEETIFQNNCLPSRQPRT